MSIAKLVRYARMAVTSPPAETLRKIERRAKLFHHSVERQRIKWVSTHISDAALARALHQSIGSTAELPSHVKSRCTVHFFVDSGQRKGVIAVLDQVCPGARAHIVAAADQACEHVFDLLGSGPRHLGEEIDWHRDFIHNHRWDPQTYFGDIRSAPYPGGYELKVPWELSRCQHLVWLGQAYWLTEDERYAQEYVAQILSWIDQNPPLLGVNWACTMDVGIRVVNWLWAHHFFTHSPSLDDEFYIAFYKSLLSHGRHIMKNLEWRPDLTSNHYLSNLVGLVYLGILAPELKEAERWCQFGLQELQAEMFKQVYSDGVDFEASVSYHRLVAEIFLSATLLAQLNGHLFDSRYLARLEKMLEFVMAVTKPDGTVPLIGDCDNGRLHRLKVWPDPAREWVDHRTLLAIGAVLWNRADFSLAAGDQWGEAVWFWGERVLSHASKTCDTKKATRVQSTSFSEAGIYVLRSDKTCMIVNAGRNGQNGNAGHAHNDALSFELFGGGHTWIVDPGSYLYTADHVARHRFRSTRFHNTVMAYETEQNECDISALFTMSDDTHPTVLHWSTTAYEDRLTLEHDGYRRLPQDIVHQRQIVLDKQIHSWIIKDMLSGSGQCQAVLYLQVDCTQIEFTDDKRGVCLHHESLQHSLSIEMTADGGHGEWSIEDACYSPSYGLARPIRRLRWWQHEDLPFEFRWSIRLIAN